MKRLFCLVFLFELLATLQAQETTGTIRGRVNDPQGLGVPGATITAAGVQGSTTTTSDSEGRFNIPFLTPGQYTIRAELQGFKATEQKDVDLNVGQIVGLALRLEVGGVSETVAVTVETRAVDTSTTTIGAVLETAALTGLPVGRTFAQVLYLTPGVSHSGNLGSANPSISGGTGLENLYLVDGANVTNIGFGALGSYSRAFGSLGNGTPTDFIKEIQVKTGGYEAEFGQATGGVINVVTKSGTNRLLGSAFAYTQPQDLQAAPKRYESIGGSVNTVGSSVRDIGVEVGFPAVKDHLFVFGAIDPSWRVTTLTAPPGFPLTALGDVEQERRTTSYAAKATVQPGSGHRLDASFFGDPSYGANGPQRGSALLVADTSSFSSLDFGGDQQTVRYSGVIRRDWLVEAAFARALNTVSEHPSVDTWRVVDQTVTPNRITGGIGSYAAKNRSEGWQWSAKSTNILGPHSIKYGIQYDSADYAQSNQLTGPTFTTPDERQTATGAAVFVRSDPVQGRVYFAFANFNGELSTEQTYFNLFAQDAWKVASRLSVNAGIRYEQETLSGTIVKGWRLQNNWAPRIGAAVDATGDGRTRVFGSYGVFFARLPNDLAVMALSGDESLRSDYFDANLTQRVPEGTLAAGATRHFFLSSSSADAIDPNARLTYTNEVIVGIEREVLPRTSVGVRYVFRHMPRVIEDVANCPIVAYDLDATASACGSSIQYVLTNPSREIPINPQAVAIIPAFGDVRFDDPVHKYNAVEVTLNRRGARWSSMMSYRWSRLRGNYEGFYRDDNAQADPGLSSLYDFPTNDPTYTSIGSAIGYSGDIRLLGDPNGILPLDRPHQVKVYSNYEWVPGLNIGVGVNLSSGKPLTPMASQPNYLDKGEIPLAARGDGIQTVDGFLTRTPFERQVDLQASYTLKLTEDRRVTFIADMFNVFNEKHVRSYDQNTQLFYPTPNPDFGTPISTLLPGNPPQFQAPFALRVGVRFQF